MPEQRRSPAQNRRARNMEVRDGILRALMEQSGERRSRFYVGGPRTQAGGLGPNARALALADTTEDNTVYLRGSSSVGDRAGARVRGTYNPRTNYAWNEPGVLRSSGYGQTLSHEMLHRMQDTPGWPFETGQAPEFDNVLRDYVRDNLGGQLAGTANMMSLRGSDTLDEFLPYALARTGRAGVHYENMLGVLGRQGRPLSDAERDGLANATSAAVDNFLNRAMSSATRERIERELEPLPSAAARGRVTYY